MDNFPKKYNQKNIIKNQNIKNRGIEVISSSIPLDQKINPGEIFSMYYNDTYCKIKDIEGENFQNVNGYTLSSTYYSTLDAENNNKAKIELSKQVKKNLSFIENLGLNTRYDDLGCTFSESFNIYIRDVFAKLFPRLSHGQDIVNRSKDYQTDLISNNIIAKDVEVPRFTIKYFIESKGVTVNIVTTRIETIFGDVAVAVNPSDKRYKKLIGQNVIIPIINKSIPIIGDDSVDVFYGDGIMRVTPGHDLFGLQLAQKYGLSTDSFAIDTKGNFTELAGGFAGKPVSEFLENIIKYIDDIGNLESQDIVKETRYFDKNTGEELMPLSLYQRNIIYDYAKDYLFNSVQESENFDHRDFEKEAILSKLEEKKKTSISNKSSKGLLIPVVSNSCDKSFLLDDETIIKQYSDKKSKKDIVMTLIISNLILDNNLSSVFSLQDLIDALFSRNNSGEETKISEYMKIYESKGEVNSNYKNGIKSLKKLLEGIDKNIETISVLSEILKDNFAIIELEDDKYCINYYDLFGEKNLELQAEDSFNKGFIDTCRFMYHYGCQFSSKTYQETEQNTNIFIGTHEDIDKFLNICLLSLQYAKKNIFSDFISHPDLVDEKGQKICNYNSKFLNKDYYENLNLYGLDVMRLTLLFGNNPDESDLSTVIFDTFDANKYNKILNKIWNANRYIYSKYDYKYGKETIKAKDILSAIDDGLTDYDIWMLHNLKILIDDFLYQSSEGKYLSIGKKILANYINFFCDKYINIVKISNNEKTTNIIVLIGMIYLDLLYPYIPNFISDIKSKFNIDRQGITLFSIRNIELKEKNYKINIFMDIVDKIGDMKQGMGLKQHEFIDIAIKANPDFLQFLQENESEFRLLTRIQKIDLLKFHEDIPAGYIEDNVINIGIGIKKPEEIVVEVAKDVLANLEKDLEEKMEHIQHLKSLFTSVYMSAGPDIVQKKKEEIAKLQGEIEDLEFKIGKLKINNN